MSEGFARSASLGTVYAFAADNNTRSPLVDVHGIVGARDCIAHHLDVAFRGGLEDTADVRSVSISVERMMSSSGCASDSDHDDWEYVSDDSMPSLETGGSDSGDEWLVSALDSDE